MLLHAIAMSFARLHFANPHILYQVVGLDQRDGKMSCLRFLSVHSGLHVALKGFITYSSTRIISQFGGGLDPIKFESP